MSAVDHTVYPSVCPLCRGDAPVSADVLRMRRAWSGYHGKFPWQRQLSATASISGGEREECRWRRGGGREVKVVKEVEGHNKEEVEEGVRRRGGVEKGIVDEKNEEEEIVEEEKKEKMG